MIVFWILRGWWIFEQGFLVGLKPSKELCQLFFTLKTKTKPNLPQNKQKDPGSSCLAWFSPIQRSGQLSLLRAQRLRESPDSSDIHQSGFPASVWGPALRSCSLEAQFLVGGMNLGQQSLKSKIGRKGHSQEYPKCSSVEIWIWEICPSSG